jgi:CelD/BcsL family acetyltransferase involved in cellulose biosynthesis
MLSADLYRAQDLPAKDRTAWHEMMAATDAFKSPLLSPEFCEAIARVRDDVFISVFRQNGATVGILAHHRRPDGLARPVGAPFSDYSGIICVPDPQFSMAEALTAAGIDRFAAIGLVDPYGMCGVVEGEDEQAFGLNLMPDAPPNNANKKLVKNINRLKRNLAEAHGEPMFVFPDHNRAHFDKMIAQKKVQLAQNGLHDFLAPVWVQQLFETLLSADESGLHGAMLTLMVNDVPIISHFGLRLGERMHPWVSSFDPDYRAFSPGQIFLNGLHEPLRAGGIAYYDLATGQDHYKALFCNTQFKVKHAKLYGQSASAKRQKTLALAGEKVESLMGPVGRMVHRLNRRIDQIACLEQGVNDRLSGVMKAFANLPKRLHSGTEA